jgi:hypothetical protein
LPSNETFFQNFSEIKFIDFDILGMLLFAEIMYDITVSKNSWFKILSQFVFFTAFLIFLSIFDI